MNKHDKSSESSSYIYTSGNHNNLSPTYLKEENSINWPKYLFLFIRNWYWFLIALGIGLGIAFFKIRYTIPIYQATATLIIEEDESSQDVMNQLRTVRFWRRQMDLANETAKLSAFTLINRAVDSLDQEIHWTAHGRIRTRPLYKNSRFRYTLLNDSVNWYKGKEWYIDYIDNETYRFYRDGLIDTIFNIDSCINLDGWQFTINLVNKSGYEIYSFSVNDQVSQTKKYQQKLRIESNEQNGSVIILRSEGPVGEREVDFLNVLSKIYILSELERKQTIAENTFTFIDKQIIVILDSLNEAENQLLTFRLTNNVINLSREGEIAYDRLKSFHERGTSLKLKENYYSYLKRYIEERNDPQTIIAPTLSGDGDQLLIAAIQDLQQLYKEREDLDLSVQSDNPRLDNINQQIRGTRIRTIEIVKGLIENNRLTQEQLNTEELAILDQLKNLPLSEQELLNIKRKYDLYNQFYTFLLQKRAEAGIQKASAISNVRILDSARSDQLIQVGSDKKLLVLLAILFGIAFPGSILFLREILDNRIREREDISKISTIPIIGILGHATDTGIPLAKSKPNSAFIESLRHIRTNLTFALREKDEKVIMVTSSVSGEGKTFCAANIAAIFAMNHRKVLLVGCDLRRPTLHKIFGLSNEAGITSYIIGSKKIEEVILQSNIENLFVIPGGPIPPNPAELIETQEMKVFFEKARREFDHIIIDTPPIAMVADALSLASYADLTLYLVRQNHSHKDMLEIANTMKSEEKLPKIYILINDIQASKSMGMYYSYGYSKGYSYGYYGENYSENTE